jgi:hypothetical protein
MRKLLRLCLTTFLLAPLPALAQTCADPATFQPPPGGGTATGTTCGGDTTATGYCGNLAAPGPAYVFEVVVSATGTYNTLSVTGNAGFDPVIYLSDIADGCGTNAACVPQTPIPPGSYFLIVTARPTDSNGSCGLFTLTADGSLPVTLQSFTVS